MHQPPLACRPAGWPDPSALRPAAPARRWPDAPIVRVYHSPGDHMLTSADVPLAESALLVIDAQASFTVTPRWARRANPAFDANVAALVEAHRTAGLPVFYFLPTDGDAEFALVSPHPRLLGLLAPPADEPALVEATRCCST